MDRVVVLLRGINVGGRNRLAMADLRAVLEGLGCARVATYLQSGNAVVTWSGGDVAAAAERALRDAHGLDVAVLTRTGAELDAVVARNPFEADPTLLHAVFLGSPVPPGVLDPEALLPDLVAEGPGVLYVRYAAGSHGSRASKLLSSRRFPVVATARNWRTVLALRDLALAS